MPKTILITGASSGIGKATARHFAEKGWNVAATMRKPENETELIQLPNVKCFRLDVLDEASIRQAIREATGHFGEIDALLNNAGYAAVGAFEAAEPAQIQRQFDTNVFGVMNVTRAILPDFRRRKAGTIITITSMGGLITFPIYSLYHATKWAVEGFMESLHYELRPFNIRVRLIEPGAIKTDFYDRSMDVMTKDGLHDYDAYVNNAHHNMLDAGANAPGPEVVAKKVMQAATENGDQLRYSVGGQGPVLLSLRRMLPLSWFSAMVRSQVEKPRK